MNNPSIQNDFSYYRRILGRTRDSEVSLMLISIVSIITPCNKIVLVN